MKCSNCGDEFAMVAHAPIERARLGWCVGCFQQRETTRVTTRKGHAWRDDLRAESGRRRLSEGNRKTRYDQRLEDGFDLIGDDDVPYEHELR